MSAQLVWFETCHCYIDNALFPCPWINFLTRVQVTGGSGFIAAHVIETLLKKGHSVVTTVRSDEKGRKILEAHQAVGSDVLSYVVVPDMSKTGGERQCTVGFSEANELSQHSTTLLFHLRRLRPSSTQPALIISMRIRRTR